MNWTTSRSSCSAWLAVRRNVTTARKLRPRSPVPSPPGLFECWWRKRGLAACHLCAIAHLPCFPYWYSPAGDTKDGSRFCWASGNPGKALCPHGLVPPPRQNRHLLGKRSGLSSYDNMKSNFHGFARAARLKLTSVHKRPTFLNGEYQKTWKTFLFTTHRHG